jgi:hypothetical protein
MIMASKTLPKRRRKTQPSKQQLATVTQLRPLRSPASWERLDSKIEKAVNDICRDYDLDAVRGLMFILDLIFTSEIASERNGVIESVRRYAFRYTQECAEALEQYLNRVNPLRQKGANVS